MKHCTFRIVDSISTESLADDARINTIVSNLAIPSDISIDHASQSLQQCRTSSARPAKNEQHLSLSDNSANAMEDLPLRLFNTTKLVENSHKGTIKQRRNSRLESRRGSAALHSDIIEAKGGLHKSEKS